MKRLVNCLGKLVGKRMITKEDADHLVREARSYEAEGHSPAEAERMAVKDAIEQTINNGENLLEHIRTNVPDAHTAAHEYWNREVIRKVGAAFTPSREAAPPEAPPVTPPVEQPGALTPPVELPAAPPAQTEAPPVEKPAPETEAPPPPHEPTPAQWNVIGSVPPEQQDKLKKALVPNAVKDPHKPIPRGVPPIDAEKNPVIGELSKYGVFDPDSTTKSVLEKIAADKTQPRWMRTITDLLNQIGGHENVEIEVVNLPGSNWPALYEYRGNSKPAKIYINLAMTMPKGGVARAIAHEVTHNLTYMKLRYGDDRVPLTDSERAAKEELIKIFDSIKNRPEFKDEYGASEPWEFASEIFSNEGLRAKLNAIQDPDAKVSLMRRIRDAIARLVFGGQEIKAGSLLEEAMRNTINVAGVRAAGDGMTTAAMNDADRVRLLNLLHELPHFHDEIINNTAPMLADMKITAQKRITDPESAWYDNNDRALLETALDKAIAKEGWKLTKEERAQFSKSMEIRVKAVRSFFPRKTSWATDTLQPSGVELKESKKGVRKVDVEFATGNYTFDRDADGNYITRYLQGATPTEQKKGVPLIDNPEWHKRVEEIASKGVDKMMELINRKDDQSDTILAQIGWYKEMVDHLRHSYGGMSDLMADLLGTFSPMTGMKENWSYGVQALGKVMRGDYDELLSRVDKWMKEDPKRTLEGWKKLHGDKGMIVKENGKLFGQNSIHGMKALLDLWRIVQEGSAPKARNFTLNLIGNSYKATIDRWAARFLQRMHAPDYRIPTLNESDVPGEHMTGELIDKVDKGFGLGQDIFQSMVDKMQAIDPKKFADLTPADLQAIMWFLEKEIWEKSGWTKVQGAANSARALAAAEGISRYEVGLSRDRTERRVTTEDQKIHGMKLQNQIASIPHAFASKVMDTLSMYMGGHERAFDTETLVYPEYDPEHLVNHVVTMGAQADQDSLFVSRVLAPGEKNENSRPGMTVFLKNQVSFDDMAPIMRELEKLGIGAFTLQVDPRAKEELRPEVMAQGRPDRFNGIRVQFIPEFSENKEADQKKMNEAMIAAKNILLEHGNVSYIGSYNYDTLVLFKGEYDPTGNITDAAANSRREAWLGRARDAHGEARNRRDEAKALIDRNDAEFKRIEREQKLLEEQQLAEISSRIEKEGGGHTAALSEHDQGTEEPINDPVTGRPSLVRALSHGEANAGGAGFPAGSLTHAGLRHTRSSAKQSGSRPPSVWQSLGGAFRAREAELHQSLQGAGESIQRLNEGESKYQTSQRLFDYLVNPDKEVTDPTIESEIANLRERIPVVNPAEFKKYKQLRRGQEATVYHDKEGRVVYKLFPVVDGKMKGGYIPGQMRLDEDGKIRVGAGPKPSFQQFLQRVDNTNNHGKLAPMEFIAVTDDGQAVFAQPFVAGQMVKPEKTETALDSLGMKLLTDLGGTAAIGKVGDKYVLFDDLHQDNLRSLPGGRYEAIDTINRDLTADETEHLRKLGKLPEESLTAPLQERDEEHDAGGPRAEPVQDDTDVVSAPLAPRGRLSRFMAAILGQKEEGTYRTEGRFMAGGAFNDKIQEAMRTKVQNGKAYMMESAFLANEFNRTAKEVYGKDGPDEAQNRTINLALGNLENRLTKAQADTAKLIRDPKLRMQYIDAAEHSNIFLYKQEQRRALNSLPDAMRDIIVRWNDSIVIMNDALIRDGNLTPDLRAAIQKNKGTYLHRSYQIFEDNDHWKNRLLNAEQKGDTEMINRLNAARAVIYQDVLKEKVHEYAKAMRKAGTPVTRADALAYARALNIDHDVQNTLNDYINIGDDPIAGRVSLYGGARPGSKGLAIMRERGQVRKEIRDLWGEWDNPAVNFAKSYTAIGTYLENNRFQRQVLTDGLANNYIWKEGSSTGPHPLGWVPLVPEGSKTMDTLAGTYGPKLLRDALSVMNSPSQKAGLEGLLSGMMALPLAAKTVYSTGSAVRNFWGNLAFVYGNGNFFGPYGKAAQAAFAEATKSTQGMRDYVVELTKLGVFGDNVDANMLKTMVSEAHGNEFWKKVGENLPKAFSGLPAGAQESAKKFAHFFPNAYTAADSYWKAYGFESELGKLKWAHAEELRGLTGPALDARIQELKGQAAKIVRRTMPTYSEAWSVLNETKAVGKFLAPFIKFKTEVLRVGWGTIKQGSEEIRSSNPKIQKVGALRLASATAVAFMPFIIAAATKAMFGYDDEQDEAIRSALPDWQKNASLMFLPKDANGNPQFIDLSYMNPFNVVDNPIVAGMRSYGHDPERSLREAGMKMIFEAAKPFLSEQLWLSAVTDILRNQDTGKNYQPLWNTQGSDAQMFGAWGERAFRAVSPGTLDSIVRIGKGLRGDINQSGKEYSAPNEALAMLGGARLTTLDRQQALQRVTSEFERNKLIANKLFADDFTNRGTISRGAVEKGYRQANEARKALYYKMRQNYLGSLKLGLTKQEASRTMLIGFGSEAAKKGIDMHDIDSLINGRYTRYMPSKEALAMARQKHPERYQEFLKAYNDTPAWEDISAQ
jgi:hypothetical protein